MKNRLLPCCLSTLLLGFALLLFTDLTYAAGPENTPSGDRLQKMRVNQTSGTVNPADVMKARLQLEKNRTKNSFGLGLTWESMGPANFCGRSHVVVFDNRDTSGLTLYTGGVTGGVWKSSNLGLTWSPVNTESQQILNITAMTQQASGTLYLGTGEIYCGEEGKMGTGLYKSDNGFDFYVIPGATPIANDPSTDWAFVKKLTVNPATGRLFAITNKGLRYSDNGNDWFTVKNGDASDVVVGPDGLVIIAVNDSVFVSVSGNLSSFVNVSNETPTSLPLTNVGRIEFAAAPSDPNILYASIAKESDGLLLNIYRSLDKGATWSVIFPNNPTFEPFEGSGCAANTLAVFPDNPYKILLGGFNFWYGEEILPTGYYNWEQVADGMSPLFGEFYVPYNQYDCMFDPGNPARFAIASDNGVTIGTLNSAGITFQTTNKNLLTSQMNSVAFSLEQGNVMGGGQQVGIQVIGALVANEPKNGVNLFAPLDWTSGSSCEWSMINPRTIFYGSSEVDYVTTEPYFRSDDLGATISPTFLGGLNSSITELLPTRLWESFNFENTRDTVVYKAIDTIAAGETIYPESANVRFKFPYVTPVSLMPGDSILVPDVVQNRFFIYGSKGGKSGVFMTKDALKFSVDPEWFQLGETDPIVCLSLSSDLNYLWAGTEDGKLYRFSNLALAYNEATANYTSPTCIVAAESFSIPEFAGRYITSLSVDPQDNNTVLVTLGNYGNDEYVYMTQNALDSLPDFASVQGDLPSTPVFSGLIEMHDGNRVILGTDMGVFATDNISSGLWTADYNGMGDVPVTMIRQQITNHYLVQNYGTIYAASYGNGLFTEKTFYTPLGVDPGQPGEGAATTLKVVPNPARDLATVHYVIKGQTRVNLSVTDMFGRQVLLQFLGNQTEGSHSALLDLSGLKAGTYIVRVNDAQAKVVKIQ